MTKKEFNKKLCYNQLEEPEPLVIRNAPTK